MNKVYISIVYNSDFSMAVYVWPSRPPPMWTTPNANVFFSDTFVNGPSLVAYFKCIIKVFLRMYCSLLMQRYFRKLYIALCCLSWLKHYNSSHNTSLIRELDRNLMLWKHTALSRSCFKYRQRSLLRRLY